MSIHAQRSASETVVDLRLERRRLPQSSLLKVPRQARAIETVHAILDAAIRVLAHDGPAGFNTNRVAEVAGVSPGSLYQYFANREMILAALVERCVLQAESVVRAALRGRQDLPVAAVLRTAVDALAEELERHSAMLADLLILAPLLTQNGMTAVLETRVVEAVREYLAAHPAPPLPGNGAGLFVGVNGCIFVLLKWAAERPPSIPRQALVEAIAAMAGEAVTRAPRREPMTLAVP